MRSVLGKRTVMLGVVLVVLAAALVGAYALAGSAPATTRKSAPIWLGTADTMVTGHGFLVGGGIDAKADLTGAVIRFYKREAGQNVDTYVGKTSVKGYSLATGNQFYFKGPRLTRNCIITAVWGGNDSYFGSRTWEFEGVTPKVSIIATQATETRTRLRIDIRPLQPTHGYDMPETLASVERLVDGVWTYFPGDLSVESTDGQSWCAYNYFNVPAGTYTIRADFKGTNYNAASVSKPVQIVVP